MPKKASLLAQLQKREKNGVARASCGKKAVPVLGGPLYIHMMYGCTQVASPPLAFLFLSHPHPRSLSLSHQPSPPHPPAIRGRKTPSPSQAQWRKRRDLPLAGLCVFTLLGKETIDTSMRQYSEDELYHHRQQTKIHVYGPKSTHKPRRRGALRHSVCAPGWTDLQADGLKPAAGTVDHNLRI